jgi:hypothetical protein
VLLCYLVNSTKRLKHGPSQKLSLESWNGRHFVRDLSRRIVDQQHFFWFSSRSRILLLQVALKDDSCATKLTRQSKITARYLSALTVLQPCDKATSGIFSSQEGSFFAPLSMRCARQPFCSPLVCATFRCATTYAASDPECHRRSNNNRPKK